MTVFQTLREIGVRKLSKYLMPELWRAIAALAGDYAFEWIVETNGDYTADPGHAANDN